MDSLATEPADVVFESGRVRIVCISDTHNDDPSPHVPPGDIFVHAGDMTDDGTPEELDAAFAWIAGLTHRVKVIVAGNHEMGLDRDHAKFAAASLAKFTSAAARAVGIHYIYRDHRTVAQVRTAAGYLEPIRIDGNPSQPDFLNSSYAFTYAPYPDPSAVAAWTTAPPTAGPLDVWVTHSPPRNRLDAIDLPPLIGCDVLAAAIARAKPALCVFGHYHSSWGLERVTWRDGCDQVAEAHKLTSDEGPTEFDFAGSLRPGHETIFVNAAWMTMLKTAVPKRNMPLVVTLGATAKSG